MNIINRALARLQGKTLVYTFSGNETRKVGKFKKQVFKNFDWVWFFFMRRSLAEQRSLARVFDGFASAFGSHFEVSSQVASKNEAFPTDVATVRPRVVMHMEMISQIAYFLK